MKHPTRFVILVGIVAGICVRAGEAVQNGSFEEMLAPNQLLYAQPFDLPARATPFRHSYGDAADIGLNTVDDTDAKNAADRLEVFLANVDQSVDPGIAENNK